MTLPQASSGFFVGWGTLSLINAGLAQAKAAAVSAGGWARYLADRWRRC